MVVSFDWLRFKKTQKEIEKLSLSICYGSRSSVWHTKRIHDTWKVVKGMSSFNFDLIFDSDL